MQISANAQALAYLVSAVLFIFSLKGLTHPSSARRGNHLGMLGMAIAVAATLLGTGVQSYGFIIAGVLVGGLIGVVLAMRIQMTAMPQLVAALHSFVGLAAVLVAVGTFLNKLDAGQLNAVLMGELSAGAIIGAITFTGSVIAFGKLQGLISGKPVKFSMQHQLNAAIALMTVALGVHFAMSGSMFSLAVMILLALVLGVTLIIPIGGADMPVIISMLNSYSGWAAAATGFMLSNDLLIVVGALVGSSGAILSYIMCRAMNRNFISVIAGGFGTAGGETLAGDEAEAGEVIAVEAAEVAELLLDAREVMIIPGYGMAVAQAQHVVNDITRKLRDKKINVRFGIHPVAGRMPGHMNVLLAEAKVPYDIVFELDEINDDFPHVDVSVVIGANDIVNPAAQEVPDSPIAGMPVLECWKGRTTVVLKRSMATGYAGVSNPLFYKENTRMLFGDARESLTEVLKQLD